MTQILFLIGTAFFLVTMAKQCLIIIYSPRGDRFFITKILFLVFNIGIVCNANFLFYGRPSFGVVFYLISATIGFTTYYLLKDKHHESTSH